MLWIMLEIPEPNRVGAHDFINFRPKVRKILNFEKFSY